MFINYPPSKLEIIVKEYLKYKRRISIEEFAKGFSIEAKELESAINQYLEKIKPATDKFL